MWSPTHVQVTVLRSSNLLLKGKNGTNDAFVTIGLGKERYQTSVKEKSTDAVQWNEECELSIPKQGNSAEIVLTALHRNFIGDDFLGTVRIPLAEFDVSQYQSTFTKWYPLKNKLGKHNTKRRGELEVKIVFVFKPSSINVGSLSELSKEGSHRSSFGQFVGGSLLSLRKEKKGLQKLARAVGNKVGTLPGRSKKKESEDAFATIDEQHSNTHLKQHPHDADPGVISDDEDDFRFEELSHKGSQSSLSVSQQPPISATPRDSSLENLGGGEFLRKTCPASPHGVSKVRNLSSNNDANLSIFTFENNQNNALIESTPAESFSTDRELPHKRSSTPVMFFNTEHRQGAGSPQFDQQSKTKQAECLTERNNMLETTVETVPFPRELKDVSKTANAKLSRSSFEDLSCHGRVNAKEKKDKSKTSTLVSLFASPKLKTSEERANNRSSPVGVTKPIRHKDSQVDPESRLPRDILKKFDGKSREELIEMVIGLQQKLEEEADVNQKIRKYMDGVLARVIDTSPTILQVPYIETDKLNMKANTWNF